MEPAQEQADAVDDRELVLELRDEILVLRLNRPRARNALTPALMMALGDALLAAESDPAIRVLVLTGTGDRAFCAGMDLRSFTEGMPRPEGLGFEAFLRLMRGEAKLPVIGAANGTALAGGLELLLGCDLIVLAVGSKLGLPEVKRGLFAAGGGFLLGKRIPLSIALELTLTGDPLEAARAAALGLVNAVVPAREVLDTALAYASRIASNGPLGVQASKELVRLAAKDEAEAWTRSRELQELIWASNDAKEGAAAFLENRSPVWSAC